MLPQVLHDLPSVPQAALVLPVWQVLLASRQPPGHVLATHWWLLQVWLVEHTESDMVDISASPEQLVAVAGMGASLVASSYFYAEDDE